MSIAEWITSILAVLALAISIASYRHASSIKRLDLRLEARKARANLQAKFDDVEALMLSAKESRLGAASISGRLRSGMMERWERDHAEHTEQIENLRCAGVRDEITYQTMSDSDLELEITNIHKVSITVGAIEAVYRNSISEDARTIDDRRKHLEKIQQFGTR